MEVSEVEPEECLQPNPCVVSGFKVIADHENQESDEPGKDDQLLPEVSNDSGKEGSAETGSSADNALPGDQTDIKSTHDIYLAVTLIKLSLTFLINLQLAWKWQRLKQKNVHNQIPV